ncbi:hypothetical protein BBP40_006019 [Aspergillus hancockii]|nr:hypothetical protein BBP40_006019 [Aspergillus hancockii]
MSQGRPTSELEDVTSLTVEGLGEGDHLTLDPRLLDFTFPYVQPSSELLDVEPLEINQQLAHSSTSLPASLGHDCDRESLLATSADDISDGLRATWLSADPKNQRPHSALPEVSGISPAESNLNPRESECVAPSFNLGTAGQYSLPKSDCIGLPRRRSRYLVNRAQEQSAPIFIPNASVMDPMERWRESPPEDEPASMSAILRALEKSPAKQPTRPRSSRSRTPPQMQGLVHFAIIGEPCLQQAANPVGHRMLQLTPSYHAHHQKIRRVVLLKEGPAKLPDGLDKPRISVGGSAVRSAAISLKASMIGLDMRNPSI